MKSWQVLFRQAKRDSGAQGGSTGEDDFNDEAADDALAEEGQAELDEEGNDEEVPESEDDADQSEEDQDGEEEEEGEEEAEDLEEEPEERSFRFKNEKTGDFDFKRINKVLGGVELESYFKEQNATITRTSQELKSYKELGAAPQELKSRSSKAQFLDKMYDEDPGIRREVNRVLGIADERGDTSGGEIKLPDGVDPKDPLAQPLIQALKQMQSISNRLQMDDQRKHRDTQEQKFATSLNEGRARFKELTGKALSPDQEALLNQEMRESGYANSSRLIPGLFFEEIRAAEAAKHQQKRLVKKNLPRNSSKGKSPAPGKAKKRSREAVHDELWNEHMSDE